MKKTALRTTASAALTFALLSLSAQSGSAATLLATYDRDYGSRAGKVDPGGSDELKPDAVIVSDHSRVRFSDSVDFSGLAYDSIDRFEISLTYKATNRKFLFVPLEFWRLRVQGSDFSAFAEADDASFGLKRSGGWTTSTFTVDVSSDVGGVDAFARSIAAEEVSFIFAEGGLLRNKFKLDSASVSIFGTSVPPSAGPAPVPLPAGFPLLAAGLGGLAMLRRRKTA